MAVRTKRARMLYKLMYLLGPDNERYLYEEGKDPLSFTKAVNKTLALFGYSLWNDRGYPETKEQLIKDYANFMKKISDDGMVK
jgi:hypothetical protein